MSEATQPTGLRELGYYEPTELSQLLRVGTPTLRNWRYKGIGPPYTKINGQRVAYPIKEAQRWLAARIVRPKPTMTCGSAGKRPA
ncbi:MAG: helix-turn-helix domain-containing protein [Steroidobacteraceae bacterium]